jgi:hypothetical protein
MDKAEIVFQKYAGIKNVLNKGLNYLKRSIKGESAALPRTPLLDKISPRYSGNDNFTKMHYGQVAPSNNIKVSKPWDKEKKLWEVEIERNKRKAGLS